MSYKTRYFLGYLLPLSSIEFFNPLGIISPVTGKIIYLFCWFLTFILIWKNSKKDQLQIYPKVGYVFLYIGFITGYAATVIIHKQDLLSISPILQILLAYSSFFLFIKLNLTRQSVFKIIKNLTILGFLVYLINRIFYPDIIFGTKSGDDSRGMLRLAIPFIELQVLMFFYYIHNISKTGLRRSRNNLWCFLYGLIILLSLTRQVMIAGYGLGLMLYLRKANIKKKFVALGLVGVITIFIIPSLPLYKNIMAESEREASKTDGYENSSRVMAWIYYTNVAQESMITRIFGNGMPIIGRTQWGQRMDLETQPQGPGTGWFTTDVGWAGYYFYFGVFAVIGVFTLLFKSTLCAKRENLVWISYWFIYIFITTFTSGAIIYIYQIIPITLAMYYVYANDSHNYSRIQQCDRHHKLYSIS